VQLEAEVAALKRQLVEAAGSPAHLAPVGGGAAAAAVGAGDGGDGPQPGDLTIVKGSALNGDASTIQPTVSTPIVSAAVATEGDGPLYRVLAPDTAVISPPPPPD
jgi:hypothetical protein